MPKAQDQITPTEQYQANCTRSSCQLHKIMPTAQDHHANCTRSSQLHKIIMPTAQDHAKSTK